MKLFNKLFDKRERVNPYYTKLTNGLLKAEFRNNIKAAYRLLGVIYSLETFDLLKKAIAQDSIRQLKDNATFNVMLDSLELYLVEDDRNNFYFIILLDPYELLESEQVLEIIPAINKDLGFESELIFSTK